MCRWRQICGADHVEPKVKGTCSFIRLRRDRSDERGARSTSDGERRQEVCRHGLGPTMHRKRSSAATPSYLAVCFIICSPYILHDTR